MYDHPSPVLALLSRRRNRQMLILTRPHAPCSSWHCPCFPFPSRPPCAACVVLLLPRDATFDLATHHLGLLQAIMSWLAAKISESTEGAPDATNAHTTETPPMPSKLVASKAPAPMSPLRLNQSSGSQNAAASPAESQQWLPSEGLRQRTGRAQRAPGSND